MGQIILAMAVMLLGKILVNASVQALMLIFSKALQWLLTM